jgi:hypothetical protein
MNPAVVIPLDLLARPNPGAAANWIRLNQDNIPRNIIANYNAAPDQAGRTRVLVDFINIQKGFVDTYNRELAAYNAAQGAPPQQAAPVVPPIQPQQPDPAQREARLTDANIRLIRALEGRRLDLAAARLALANNPAPRQPGRQDPTQLQYEVDRRVRQYRKAEARVIGNRIANIPYDAAMGPPLPAPLGDGKYGGVSADMAGMDEEYLDLELHDGFVERGNWSGMMKALAGMPTHPYGAGIKAEEGEEMPIGVSGSAHRVGFYDGGDLMSDEEEPEEEMEDDDEYDREMAGRGQLDDVAERIQANRQKSELNVAKGGARNMKEMLAKLKSKIRC